MNVARLENWWVDHYDQLHGRVYGDSRPGFIDGGEITTSRVVKMDEEGRAWAVTKNTKYLLGTPREERKNASKCDKCGK